MIHQFNMSYSHDFGIEAWLDRTHKVYLGWNIVLNDRDIDGTHFMAAVETEMSHFRARYQKDWCYGGTWSVWKLVESCDLDRVYDNSDSEPEEEDPW